MGKARREPRIYDVARKAGVSTATVSRVVNGKDIVERRTVVRVREVMRQLGYRPHALARGLAARRSHTIGLLITDMLDPYFTEIVRGTQEQADREGYAVLLADASVHPPNEDVLIDRLMERRVDGLVVASSRTTRSYALLLRKEAIPVVCINGKRGDFPRRVQIDNRVGARLAVEHLVALGHRRIAHLAGPHGVVTRTERLAGYRNALEGHGLPFDPRLVTSGDGKIAESVDATRALLTSADAPTAIFAYNDRSAVGCYRAVLELGLRVGRDVSVVGFDDVYATEWIDPPLTTIHQPRAEMGRLAVKLLLSVVRGEAAPEEVIVMPWLVERASTARVRSASRMRRRVAVVDRQTSRSELASRA